MPLSEKSAHLKGLMDGMKLNTETNEGRMLAAIVDLLQDVTDEMDRLDELTLAISDEMDDLEEEIDDLCDALDELEEDFDDEDDDDDYEDDLDDDDLEDDDDLIEVLDSDEDTIYEVTCKCGEVIQFGEDVLEAGSMTCPNCGETLEFTVEYDDEDEEVEDEE